MRYSIDGPHHMGVAHAETPLLALEKFLRADGCTEAQAKEQAVSLIADGVLVSRICDSCGRVRSGCDGESGCRWVSRW